MAIGPVVTRGYGSFGTVNLVVTRGYGATAAVPSGRPRRRALPPLRVLPGVKERLPEPFDSVLTFLVAPPLVTVAASVARERISVSVFSAPVIDVALAPREIASGQRRFHVEAVIDDLQEIGMDMAVKGDARLLAAVRAWKRAK